MRFENGWKVVFDFFFLYALALPWVVSPALGVQEVHNSEPAAFAVAPDGEHTRGGGKPPRAAAAAPGEAAAKHGENTTSAPRQEGHNSSGSRRVAGALMRRVSAKPVHKKITDEPPPTRRKHDPEDDDKPPPSSKQRHSEADGKLSPGDYEVWLEEDMLGVGHMSVACDGSVGMHGLSGSRLYYEDVRTKCSSARDKDATMYLTRTFLPTQYQCLKKDGNTLKGNSYEEPNDYVGDIEINFKLTKARACAQGKAAAGLDQETMKSLESNLDSAMWFKSGKKSKGPFHLAPPGEPVCDYGTTPSQDVCLDAVKRTSLRFNKRIWIWWLLSSSGSADDCNPRWYWQGAPAGCSVRTGVTWWSPTYKDGPPQKKGCNSKNFQLICSGYEVDYHLAPRGAVDCDYGHTPDAGTCKKMGPLIADRYGYTKYRQPMTGSGGKCKNGWGAVPGGCSLQTGNDWATFIKTSNTKAGCAGSDRQKVCTGTEVQFHLAPPGSRECDTGSPVPLHNCKKVIELLAARRGRHMTRNTVVGGGSWWQHCAWWSWGRVPVGCSAYIAGSNFVPIFKGGEKSMPCVAKTYSLACTGPKECSWNCYMERYEDLRTKFKAQQAKMKLIPGVYHIWYRGQRRYWPFLKVGCDGSVRHRAAHNSKFVTTGVSSKCKERRDSSATMYLTNVYGHGKYECLWRDGDNIRGSHYVKGWWWRSSYYFWGSAYYGLARRYQCQQAFAIKHYNEHGKKERRNCGCNEKPFPKVTPGEYLVLYKGRRRHWDRLYVWCDGSAHHNRGAANTRLFFYDVPTKCSQGRDHKAQMYLTQIYGQGKYECIWKEGQNLRGSHYVFPEGYWGTVYYKLHRRYECMKEWFCVARQSMRSMEGPFEDIEDAKKALNVHKGHWGNRQMICQMSWNGAKVDAHQVGGQAQADGESAGFQRFWSGWGDMNHMRSMCNNDHYCSYKKEQKCFRTRNSYLAEGYIRMRLRGLGIADCEQACRKATFTCKGFNYIDNPKECQFLDRCDYETGGLNTKLGIDHYQCNICPLRTKAMAPRSIVGLWHTHTKSFLSASGTSLRTSQRTDRVLPSRWLNEQFQVVQAGDSQVAFWNLGTRRFLMMNAGTVFTSDVVPSGKLPPTWEEGKFFSSPGDDGILGLWNRRSKRFLKIQAANDVKTSPEVKNGKLPPQWALERFEVYTLQDLEHLSTIALWSFRHKAFLKNAGNYIGMTGHRPRAVIPTHNIHAQWKVIQTEDGSVGLWNLQAKRFLRLLPHYGVPDFSAQNDLLQLPGPEFWPAERFSVLKVSDDVVCLWTDHAKKFLSAAWWGLRKSDSCGDSERFLVVRMQALVHPAHEVGLWNMFQKRFVKLARWNVLDVSPRRIDGSMPHHWGAERFQVFDGTRGMFAFYRKGMRRFVRLWGGWKMDPSGAHHTLPAGWTWERFSILDLGDGIAGLYCPIHRRFAKMDPGGMKPSPWNWNGEMPYGWRAEIFKIVDVKAEYHLAPEGSAGCDYGLSPTKDMCERAADIIAKKNYKRMGRPLQIGTGGECRESWGGVPNGCSLFTGGDWTPHFKRGGRPTSSICVSTHYQLVCTGPEAHTVDSKSAAVLSRAVRTHIGLWSPSHRRFVKDLGRSSPVQEGIVWNEWVTERFEVVNAGAGNVAFWSPYHERFLAVGNNGKIVHTEKKPDGKFDLTWVRAKWKPVEVGDGIHVAFWNPKTRTMLKMDNDAQLKVSPVVGDKFPAHWQFERFRLIPFETRKTPFHAAPPKSGRCDFGSDLPQELCLYAALSMAGSAGRPVSQFSSGPDSGNCGGGWGNIPTGCTVQFGHGGNAAVPAHWKSKTGKAECTNNPHRKICSETAKYHLAPIGEQTCDYGVNPVGDECLHAARVLSGKPWTKMFMGSYKFGEGAGCTDGWGQVPTGCSLHSGHTWEPYYKAGEPVPRACLSDKFRLVCTGAQAEYHLAWQGASECEHGSKIAEHECARVGAHVAATYGKQMKRGLQRGVGGSCGDRGWGEVPDGCSLQSGGDWAPHFHGGPPTTRPGCPSEKYQLICTGPEVWFCVASSSNSSVKGPYLKLETAKKVLNEKKAGDDNRQMICMMSRVAGVDTDPWLVGRQIQAGDAFETYWKDDDDLRAMQKMCNDDNSCRWKVDARAPPVAPYLEPEACHGGWVKRSTACLRDAAGTVGSWRVRGLLNDCKVECDRASHCKGFEYTPSTSLCHLHALKPCGAGDAISGETVCNTEFCSYDKCGREDEVAYSLGERGKGDGCPRGSVLVTDEAECRDHAAKNVGRAFMKTGCWSGEGCLDNEKHVYFSTCKQSWANNHAPVCKGAPSLYPFESVGLWNPQFERFLRMPMSEFIITSPRDPLARWQADANMDQFKVIDAGNGEIALWNARERRFVRVNQDRAGKVDKSFESKYAELLKVPDLEKYKVINLEAGFVALWNPSTKRFLQMGSRDYAMASHEKADGILPNEANWMPYSKFKVVPVQACVNRLDLFAAPGDYCADRLRSGSTCKEQWSTGDCDAACGLCECSIEHSQAKYKLGIRGKDECPEGMAVVMDELECRNAAAAAVGRTFHEVGCWDGRGCLENNHHVYFSNCAKTFASNHAPVCKLTEGNPHCSGHGTCEADCGKAACNGARCVCDPGWGGVKCADKEERKELVEVSAYGSADIHAICPYGFKVLSGGCHDIHGKLIKMNAPDGDSAWWCAGHGGEKKVWATCTNTIATTIKWADGGDWTRVACDAGQKIVSGGCLSNTPRVTPDTFAYSSFIDELTWQCGGFSSMKRAFTICTEPVREKPLFYMRKGNNGDRARAECRAGEVSIGGGCSAGGPQYRLDYSARLDETMWQCTKGEAASTCMIAEANGKYIFSQFKGACARPDGSDVTFGYFYSDTNIWSCKARCSRSPGCTGFQWYHGRSDRKTCRISHDLVKKGKPMANADCFVKEGCASGWVKRSELCTQEELGVEGRYEGEGPQDNCKRRCKADDDCKGFSYNPGANICQFYVQRTCGRGVAVNGDTECKEESCHYDKCTEACTKGWIKRTMACSHAEQMGFMAGEYKVFYSGKASTAYKNLYLECDGSGKVEGAFDGKLQFKGVTSKCSRDRGANMYIENVRGRGKFECLRMEGSKLVGTHNDPANNRYGEPVEYRLLNQKRCGQESELVLETGTVDDCKKKCDADAECKGFSYSREQSGCKLFQGRRCGAGVPIPGDTPCDDAKWCNYDKCSTADLTRFELVSGHGGCAVAGGREFPYRYRNEVDLETCALICEEQELCFAIDWEGASQRRCTLRYFTYDDYVQSAEFPGGTQGRSGGTIGTADIYTDKLIARGGPPHRCYRKKDSGGGDGATRVFVSQDAAAGAPAVATANMLLEDGTSGAVAGSSGQHAHSGSQDSRSAAPAESTGTMKEADHTMLPYTKSSGLCMDMKPGYDSRRLNLMECKDLCDASTACKGFLIDTQKGECFFSTRACELGDHLPGTEPCDQRYCNYDKNERAFTLDFMEEPDMIKMAEDSKCKEKKAPLGDVYVMQGDGKGKKEHKKDAEAATAHVRCCRGSDFDMATSRVMMGSYGGQDDDCDGCCDKLQDKTFEEARQICFDNKLVLCTEGQVKGGIPKETGCGFDKEKIWISNERDHEIIDLSQAADAKTCAKSCEKGGRCEHFAVGPPNSTSGETDCRSYRADECEVEQMEGFTLYRQLAKKVRPGEYEVSYKGLIHQDLRLYIGCDESATLPGGYVSEFLFSDVQGKCTQDRDKGATMYIENTWGNGKFECLQLEGSTLKGSHYINEKQYYGTVEYRLLSTHRCTTAPKKCATVGGQRYSGHTNEVWMGDKSDDYFPTLRGNNGILVLGAVDLRVKACREMCEKDKKCEKWSFWDARESGGHCYFYSMFRESVPGSDKYYGGECKAPYQLGVRGTQQCPGGMMQVEDREECQQQASFGVGKPFHSAGCFDAVGCFEDYHNVYFSNCEKHFHANHAPVCKAQYALGENGTTNCPEGMAVIESELECKTKAVSITNKHFHSTGCFLGEGCLFNGEHVYFSNCPGTMAPNHWPVCGFKQQVMRPCNCFVCGTTNVFKPDKDQKQTQCGPPARKCSEKSYEKAGIGCYSSVSTTCNCETNQAPEEEDYHLAPAGMQECDYGQNVVYQKCLEAARVVAVSAGGPSQKKLQVGLGGSCGDGGWGSVPLGCSVRSGGRNWDAYFKYGKSEKLGCGGADIQLICTGPQDNMRDRASGRCADRYGNHMPADTVFQMAGHFYRGSSCLSACVNDGRFMFACEWNAEHKTCFLHMGVGQKIQPASQRYCYLL
eukprot:TRINITY_DN19869_c0_g2_i2.p1 TRINITY_DN19869_c0_g2~~TRINITY_DN19869_c0_g2_i2.p1  ORF type:complete len:4265 (-),score=633.29 TRINITY_DN19869_c0_g2_i2:6-12800(-)